MSEILEGFLQDQVAVLKKKVAALKAENARLKKEFNTAWLERNELLEKYQKATQKFESMRDINDANLESYNNCAIEARELKEHMVALKAENERLRADDAMITAQIGQLEEERDALKEQVARLMAPVTEEDAQKYGGYGVHDDLFDKRGVMDLLATRASQKETNV